MNNIYYFRFVVNNSNYKLLNSFRTNLQNLRNRKKELLGKTRIGSIEQFDGDSYYVMDVADSRSDWDKLVHLEKLKDITMHKAMFNGINCMMVDDPYFWPKFGFYDIAMDLACFEDDESSFYDCWSFHAYTYNREFVWSYFIANTTWVPNVVNHNNITAWEKKLQGVYNRIKIGKADNFICMKSLL